MSILRYTVCKSTRERNVLVMCKMNKKVKIGIAVCLGAVVAYTVVKCVKEIMDASVEENYEDDDYGFDDEFEEDLDNTADAGTYDECANDEQGNTVEPTDDEPMDGGSFDTGVSDTVTNPESN